MVVDNTLWYGRVLDALSENSQTRSIRRLNAKVGADARVDLCMLPTSDGMTIVRKRTGRETSSREVPAPRSARSRESEGAH